LNAAVLKNKLSAEDTCWLKRMFAGWLGWHNKTLQKSKKITKGPKLFNKNQLKQLKK